MSEKHSRKTTIVLSGLEIDVEVEFTIHSWGAPQTWDDPAEPAEIDIDSVVAVDTGLDLTHTLPYRDLWCPPNRDGNYWVNGYHRKEINFLEGYTDRTIEFSLLEEIHENLHDYDSFWDY